MEDNLARLREDYPEWDIETAWTTASTGPDRRHFMARRGQLTLSAWTAEGLRAAIDEAEANT